MIERLGSGGTVIPPVIPTKRTRPSGAYWLDDSPDVSCKETTRQHVVDGWPLSGNQQVGLESPNSSAINDPCSMGLWGRIVDDTLTMRFPLTADLRFHCVACRLLLDALQAEGRGFESRHLHNRRSTVPPRGNRGASPADTAPDG